MRFYFEVPRFESLCGHNVSNNQLENTKGIWKKNIQEKFKLVKRLTRMTIFKNLLVKNVIDFPFLHVKLQVY